MPKAGLLAPLRSKPFRILWAGMGLSYAGDRLQELAQGWLVATLTNSALAVGMISILASLPMFLMPLGGVVSDQLNRRRLIITGQICGAVLTALIALLAITHQLRVEHIYLWAFASGLIWLVMRPAYKVIITEVVPSDQIRPAVSLNSITETAAIVIMNAGGSALLAWVGLPAAFIINSLSYLTAVVCLSSLPELGGLPAGSSGKLEPGRILPDLAAGWRYLRNHDGLFHPLLFTLFGNVVCSPISVLLPAIVRSGRGSIINLGILGAALSIGALLGALFAGMRSEGNPMRTYPILGCAGALLITIFVFSPFTAAGFVALVGMGFLSFSQVVWNTSRVPRLAEPAYQARLQSITSMVYTLGAPIGALWGGMAFDRYGLRILLVSAGLLLIASVAILLLYPKQHLAKS